MWYVLEKQNFLSQRDMVKQYKVLMQLSHITDVGYHG
jgi:hypothetical protein